MAVADRKYSQISMLHEEQTDQERICFDSGSNQFIKKHTQKRNYTPGNFLNLHDWLNLLLASDFLSVSTLLATAYACVLSLLSKTPCLFD